MQVSRHAPPEQAVPLSHRTPQPPQLALSVAVSTQNAPQSFSPATHVGEQRPAEHDVPAVHPLPHAPQLRLSEEVTTQLPPQSVSPEMQLVEHWPAEHTCPAGHASPQEPQLELSNEVLTQLPAHSVSPEMQPMAHRPPEHAVPLGQTVPHAPQLMLSVSIVVQMPPQSVSPKCAQKLGAPRPTPDPGFGTGCGSRVPLAEVHALRHHKTKPTQTNTAQRRPRNALAMFSLLVSRPLRGRREPCRWSPPQLPTGAPTVFHPHERSGRYSSAAGGRRSPELNRLVFAIRYRAL
jgi:hypothetical protein